MTDTLPALLARCDPADRARLVTSLPPRTVRMLNRHFPEWAHDGQIAPPGEWRTWVLMAGRGFGKTRAGAEWVMGCVRGSARTDPPTAPRQAPPSPARGRGANKVRIALVAASLDEARRVMVEGPSGILAVVRPGEVREWSFQRRRILFANGAEATLFSGAHPEGLRGPEHDFAWCDELAKWRHPQAAWDNLQLGLRRGERPQALVTTTPRRGPALTRLLVEPGVMVTGGASGNNPHLPDGWEAMQRARLTGLQARQELGGELLQDVGGALFPRALIEASRVSPILPGTGRGTAAEGGGGGGLREAGARGELGPLRQASGLPPPRFEEDFLIRVVVGIDPPAGEMGDACGIVVCGLGADGICYVLADASVSGLRPEGWARKAAATAESWGAGLAVAEANNGGLMIGSVLAGADAALPVKLVHATRGKVDRAAAAAALFEGGRAKFAGLFPALEDELAGLSWDAPYAGPGRSPDRADAMVWALDTLAPGAGGRPAVRGL